MKCLFCLIILSLSLTVSAFDHYDTPIYQANPLCPLRITLTVEAGSLEYRLRFDQTIVAIGGLNAGESVEMDLSLTDQWYVLLIEWEGDYTVSSQLVCETGDSSEDRGAELTRAIAPLHETLQALRTSLSR